MKIVACPFCFGVNTCINEFVVLNPGQLHDERGGKDAVQAIRIRMGCIDCDDHFTLGMRQIHGKTEMQWLEEDDYDIIRGKVGRAVPHRQLGACEEIFQNAANDGPEAA